MRAPTALLGLLLALVVPASAPAATFVVSNVNDGGDGSLRKAIKDAAASGEADRITFAAGGKGVIKITSSLPQIGDDDDVIGPQFTQGRPLVEIDASAIGRESALVMANSGTLENVAMTGADGTALFLNGQGNSLFNNFVGVGLDGACDGNSTGVHVEGLINFVGGAASNTGNLIRCNGTGVVVQTAAQVSLTRNTIVGNRDGVLLFGPNAQVGSARGPADANVIAGNTARGLVFSGHEATGGFVLNNFIGATAAGVADPNGVAAVVFEPGAVDNAVLANQINAGGALAIDSGPTQRNAVARNDVVSTGRFIIDGAGAGAVDGLTPPALGALFANAGGAFIPVSVANRTPHSEVSIFLHTAECHGNQAIVHGFESDSVMTDDTGAATKDVLLHAQPSGLILGVTEDQLGTPDLRNPCFKEPAGDGGGTTPPAPQTPASTPPVDTTAPSTTPVLPIRPAGTTPLPVLNLGSPFPKGFRIVSGPNGLTLVIVNLNGFPTAYDVEATTQLNLRFRAAKAGTFVLKAPRFTLAPRQSRTVRLKFSRAAKRFIARKRPRRARVTAKVTARTASGASKAFTTTRTVRLKRKKR
jgi:hypothetical protein